MSACRADKAPRSNPTTVRNAIIRMGRSLALECFMLHHLGFRSPPATEYTPFAAIYLWPYLGLASSRRSSMVAGWRGALLCACAGVPVNIWQRSRVLI
jgi:hypothetical protein